MLLSTSAVVVRSRSKVGKNGKLLPERVVNFNSEGEEPAVMVRAVIGAGAATAFPVGALVRITIELAEAGMRLYRSEP